MGNEPKVRVGKLSEFRPTKDNPNQHTERGLWMLAQSMDEDGYIAPMTVAADGESLDGSARMETAFDKFGDDVIIVEHTGDRPVVMVRKDIPNTETPQARRIIYRSNRAGEVDLSWSPEQLLADLEAGVELGEMFFDWELEKLVDGLEDQPIDPEAEWQGMPEFEQGDKTSYQGIHVHFKNAEEVTEFGVLIGQKLTNKTRSIWFTERERMNYGDDRYTVST